MRCRNDNPKVRHSGFSESTTVGHVGAEDGRLWNAIDPGCNETNPLPKLSHRHDAQEFSKVMNSIYDTIANADPNTNVEVLEALKQAAKLMAKREKTDYWLSDEGQNELLGQIDIRNKKPSSSLDMLDNSGVAPSRTRQFLCGSVVICCVEVLLDLYVRNPELVDIPGCVFV